MAEVMNSLFGVTPESLMAQREAALAQQAQNFAQLSPMQAAQAGFYTAGNRLAGAAGGLLGAQDPEMAKAATLQGILKQADTTTAEGYTALARTLAQQGFGQQASQAAQQALAMREKESVITKNLRERAAADPIQQLIRAGKYTTGSVAAYEKSGNIADLEPIDKGDPTALTETADGVFLVNKTTGEKISRIGSAPERGNKTTVNVDAKGEAEFTKELGKLDAKRVNDALTTRDTATSALNSLNKLAALPSDQLITGQFASGRVGATNLLSTLGLASPSDAQKLATSQQYQKVAGDVILQTLGGKLGAGFSNADREFIASLVPQLETNPEARRSLIKFMQAKNQDIIKESTKLENYARQNKGLSGFTPTIPMSVTPTGQYSGLSDAELAARIKAAQANQQR